MTSCLDKKRQLSKVRNKDSGKIAPNKHGLDDLPDPAKQLVEDLRRNHFETAKLEIELHRAIFAIEESSDKEYDKVFLERKKILKRFREPLEDNPATSLKHFWLTVLKGADVDLTAEDEKILEYLIDIRSRMLAKPRVQMIIEFEFEPNGYFKNRILSKTYNIKCNAEPKEAVIYDGIEILSMEGTKIDWCGERPQNVGTMPSFFEYFSEHTECENSNRAFLSEEIALGFFLREKVIPKAIYFFTGEIRCDRSLENCSEDDEICCTEFDGDMEECATDTTTESETDTTGTETEEDYRDISEANDLEEDIKEMEECNVEENPEVIEKIMADKDVDNEVEGKCEEKEENKILHDISEKLREV